MKALILCAAFAAASIPALAQTNVSINIGQPGFYGRIDLGDSRGYYGPPPVYVAQPVIIERHYRGRAEPIYLRVPPGHRKNWSKHCRKYGACGQPVLFVQDRWYNDVYAPRYRDRHHDRFDGRRDGRHDDRRDRHDDRRDRHDDRGHGRGHDKHGDKHDGRGNGRGHG
ncbi:hypothetical protein [Massilia yuzhufengensis]|uniref:Uncharacterized protein n=1 Tax=Massilia yuzhufengensis TaxID=1164594 RepID=A0A1I1PIN0_9BURK|nr:hypothetical protein [Massilia yuzhufengensis]SFD09552.1 hypothetical protein SAMN05216204_11612 [Massilia yuzhufengensis]